MAVVEDTLKIETLNDEQIFLSLLDGEQREAMGKREICGSWEHFFVPLRSRDGQQWKVRFIRHVNGLSFHANLYFYHRRLCFTAYAQDAPFSESLRLNDRRPYLAAASFLLQVQSDPDWIKSRSAYMS